MGDSVKQYKNAEGVVDEITILGASASNSDLKVLADASDVKTLTIQECKNISDAGMASATGLTGLTTLSIMHTPISDTAFDAFAGSANITELRIVNTKMTGSGLKNFSESPVESLMLQGENFDADGLAALASLTSVKDLKLVGPKLRLADAKGISEMKALESLNADQAAVGEGGINSLRGLANLKKLEVSSGDVDDASIEALNSLIALEELTLKNSSVTSSGIVKLALPALRSLNVLGSEAISDAGLDLKGLPALEELNLQGTGVSKDLTALGTLKNLQAVYLSQESYEGGKEEVAALKAILPDVQVNIIRE